MLIGITGFIGSGKNTVARHFVNKAGYTQDSFAASLKDVCSVVFGWKRAMMEGDTEESRVWREQVDPWWEERLGIEGFSPRLAMQLIGTNALRDYFHPDIWLLTVERRYEKNKYNSNTVITDARFPNEIGLIHKLGGTLIHVSTGEKPVWYDLALKAVQGDEDSLNKMQSVYSRVHYSEWAWIGIEPDIVIENTGTLEELERKTWSTHIELAGVK